MLTPEIRSFIDTLVDQITVTTSERLDAELTDICEKNYAFASSQGMSGALYSFTYAGIRYVRPSYQDYDKETRYTYSLNRTLYPMAQEYVSNLGVYLKDKKKLNQGLTLVLNGCRTKQDIRDALPDFTRKLFSDIVDLPRTRPEAWTLVDKPLLKQQFELIKELMSIHLTSGMIL